MAEKPKTVFERLEDRMRDIQTKLEEILPSIKNEVIPAIEKVKEDIPASIGPNLMTFADMIGEQIDTVSNSISNIKVPATSGPSGENSGEISSSLNQISDNIMKLNSKIDGITTEITNLKNKINGIESGSTITRIPKTVAKPAASSQTQVKAQKSSPPLDPSVKTPKTTTKPSIKPKPAPTVKKETEIPTITTELGSVPPEVFDLLDNITVNLKKGLTAQQMAKFMEDTRDKIVKLYKWHPIIYEMATRARKLKKFGTEDPIDSETYQLLLEKVQEWKERIKSG
ncbi:MAG: hypothetical protein EU550_00945 [Promethearchaeota archaeon]|nr:MAG: hypothetical protein EU550_00945 [Candidatus Lokiarchaeota archaeon]